LQLAFDNVERKYNLGMLTSFEYNSAMGQLTAAQSELLQAKYNYLFNIKILNFYRDLN
jgi:outer membrane protein